MAAPPPPPPGWPQAPPYAYYPPPPGPGYPAWPWVEEAKKKEGRVLRWVIVAVVLSLVIPVVLAALLYTMVAGL